MSPEPGAPGDHRRHRLHLSGRLLFLRFLVNAFSLAITVAVVPKVYFSGDDRILTWFLVSAVFGLVNAFLKPLLQVVMLPLIFVSYGFVVVLINTALLGLLYLLVDRFHIETLPMGILAGLVIGVVESFFHTLFGLSAPIMEGSPADLEKEIAEHEFRVVEAGLHAATGDENPAEAEDTSGTDAGRPGGGQP